MRKPEPMILPPLVNPMARAVKGAIIQGNYVPAPPRIRRIDTEPDDILISTPAAKSASPVAGPTEEVTPIERKKAGRPKKAQSSLEAVTAVSSMPAPTFVTAPKLQETPEWQRAADWKGRDLCVCFPVGKTTNPATAWTLVALALDLGSESMRADMELGDMMIYHSRNQLAERFLNSGATWSLWLDDDIVAPIGRPGWFKSICGLPDTYPDDYAGMHVAHRLMGHAAQGVKLVGGLYFGRKSAGKPMFYEGQVNHEAYEASMSFRNEVRPTEWVGTGCMLVHRDVFLEMQKNFPHLKPSAIKPYWDYFKPGEVDGEGEDVAFCRRAKESGHQPFIDLGLRCMHLGWCAWGSHNVKNYLGGL